MSEMSEMSEVRVVRTPPFRDADHLNQWWDHWIELNYDFEIGAVGVFTDEITPPPVDDRDYDGLRELDEGDGDPDDDGGWGPWEERDYDYYHFMDA